MSQTVIFEKTVTEKFNEFHRDNPEVFQLFRKFALELINAGHKRIGSKMIVERIRYETAISTTDPDYKINNNYTSHFARLFIRRHPEHTDKFEFRIMRKA